MKKEHVEKIERLVQENLEEPITWSKPSKELDKRKLAIQVYEEQKEAHLEWMDACEAEVNAKQWKMKAQKRLTLARDSVRALTIN